MKFSWFTIIGETSMLATKMTELFSMRPIAAKNLQLKDKWPVNEVE